MSTRWGRKGMTANITDMLIKMTILLIAAFAMVFLIQQYLAVSIETGALRSEIFLQRVLSSPTGIAYVDPNTGVAWPGTIDREKFTDEQLAASIPEADQDWIAAELTLDGITIRHNGERYVEWQRMVAVGSAIVAQRDIPVVVYDGATVRKGMLRVSTIAPKE